MIDELRRSGFTDGGIVEIVLVTRNREGSPNAAPMGIKLVDGYFELKPYKGSKTHENIKRGGLATVNVTHDPTIFLATSFKEEIRNQPLITTDLTLSASDISINIELKEEITSTAEYSIYYALPTKIVSKKGYPIVYSRGRSAAIEAIIHTTRVKVFIDQGRDSLVGDLTKKIEKCREIVEHVSPAGSPECFVMEKLFVLLEKWRDLK